MISCLEKYDEHIGLTMYNHLYKSSSFLLNFKVAGIIANWL